MSTYRADHSPTPPQLVLGFGNTSQRAIREGIATLGAILKPVTGTRPTTAAPP